MKKYIFLIGWFDKSDGACGEKTGVKKMEDLIDIFENKKEGQIDWWEVEGRDEQEALNAGYAKAFFANFTAHDSVSTIIEKV